MPGVGCSRQLHRLGAACSGTCTCRRRAAPACGSCYSVELAAKAGRASKPRPIWPASTAQPADWPRLSGAWGWELGADRSLRRASWPRLSQLVFGTGWAFVPLYRSHYRSFADHPDAQRFPRSATPAVREREAPQRLNSTPWRQACTAQSDRAAAWIAYGCSLETMVGLQPRLPYWAHTWLQHMMIYDHARSGARSRSAGRGSWWSSTLAHWAWASTCSASVSSAASRVGCAPRDAHWSSLRRFGSPWRARARSPSSSGCRT